MVKISDIERKLNCVRRKISAEIKDLHGKELTAYFHDATLELLRRHGYKLKRDGTIEKIKKNRQPTAISSAPAASKPTTKVTPAKKPKPAALKPAPKAVPKAAPPKAKTPKPAKKIKK